MSESPPHTAVLRPLLSPVCHVQEPRKPEEEAAPLSHGPWEGRGTVRGGREGTSGDRHLQCIRELPLGPGLPSQTQFSYICTFWRSSLGW